MGEGKPMLKDHQDAYGHEIYDYIHRGHSLEIVERDDGWVDTSLGAPQYFAPFKVWMPHEKKGMKYVRGKVLDIGCGAGRVMRYLGEKGLDVCGIDNSPLAIKVCREQGLKNARVMAITEVSRKLGVFDTIVMYGNNFGLFGNLKRARWLLRRFHAMTSEKGRIIAASTDPHTTDIKEHKAYNRLNRKRGRMPGQLRIRIRYKKYATPFFDYLLVSRVEMKTILKGTGWKINRFIDTNPTRYTAVIDKH
jgi:SAM-dependent methyltransferase